MKENINKEKKAIIKAMLGTKMLDETITTHNIKRISAIQYELNNNPKLPRDRIMRLCKEYGRLEEKERCKKEFIEIFGESKIVTRIFDDE